MFSSNNNLFSSNVLTARTRASANFDMNLDMIWFLDMSIQFWWKWSIWNVMRFIFNMSWEDSPNSRNARGLRWNHLKQRRNCGANWTSFHCSAAWAVRTVHWLAHCPVRGTLEQRISYIDCNLCDEMLRNCCSSHHSSPTTTSSEPSFSVPNTAFPLLQLAAIRPSTLQHCRPGARAPWHADTAPPWILQSALTSAWRGAGRGHGGEESAAFCIYPDQELGS